MPKPIMSGLIDGEPFSNVPTVVVTDTDEEKLDKWLSWMTEAVKDEPETIVFIRNISDIVFLIAHTMMDKHFSKGIIARSVDEVMALKADSKKWHEKAACFLQSFDGKTVVLMLNMPPVINGVAEGPTNTERSGVSFDRVIDASDESWWTAGTNLLE